MRINNNKDTFKDLFNGYATGKKGVIDINLETNELEKKLEEEFNKNFKTWQSQNPEKTINDWFDETIEGLKKCKHKFEAPIINNNQTLNNKYNRDNNYLNQNQNINTKHNAMNISNYDYSQTTQYKSKYEDINYNGFDSKDKNKNISYGTDENKEKTYFYNLVEALEDYSKTESNTDDIANFYKKKYIDNFNKRLIGWYKQKKYHRRNQFPLYENNSPYTSNDNYKYNYTPDNSYSYTPYIKKYDNCRLKLNYDYNHIDRLIADNSHELQLNCDYSEPYQSQSGLYNLNTSSQFIYL